MSKYKVTVETEYGKIISETDMVLIHVANKREDGLIETESLIGTDDQEESFRMFLSLGRAIQDNEFGHISDKVGTMQDDTELFKELYDEE